MSWREGNAPWLDESTGSETEGYSANFKLMVIAAAFLVVTIGLILMQPGKEQQQVAAIEPVNTPIAQPVQRQPLQPADTLPESDVTRASTSLLSLDDGQARVDVSQLVRSPIRLGGQFHDLRALSRTALEGFGHRVSENDPLHRLLVQALAEGQSNAYIDTLLNTAAGRGEFSVPVALQSGSGRLDTETLLQGLASLVVQ